MIIFVGTGALNLRFEVLILYSNVDCTLILTTQTDPGSTLYIQQAASKDD